MNKLILTIMTVAFFATNVSAKTTFEIALETYNSTMSPQDKKAVMEKLPEKKLLELKASYPTVYYHTVITGGFADSQSKIREIAVDDAIRTWNMFTNEAKIQTEQDFPGLKIWFDENFKVLKDREIVCKKADRPICFILKNGSYYTSVSKDTYDNYTVQNYVEKVLDLAYIIENNIQQKDVKITTSGIKMYIQELESTFFSSLASDKVILLEYGIDKNYISDLKYRFEALFNIKVYDVKTYIPERKIEPQLVNSLDEPYLESLSHFWNDPEKEGEFDRALLRSSERKKITAHVLHYEQQLLLGGSVSSNLVGHTIELFDELSPSQKKWHEDHGIERDWLIDLDNLVFRLNLENTEKATDKKVAEKPVVNNLKSETKTQNIVIPKGLSADGFIKEYHNMLMADAENRGMGGCISLVKIPGTETLRFTVNLDCLGGLQKFEIGKYYSLSVVSMTQYYNNLLNDYFSELVKEQKVSMIIIGTTDSLTINAPMKYNGEFEKINDHMDIYFLDKGGYYSTNKQLGLLRACLGLTGFLESKLCRHLGMDQDIIFNRETENDRSVISEFTIKL